MTMRRQRRPGPLSAHPSGSFTDRVMARVADEPTPSPGRVFARSLRRLAIRDALAALGTAWRLAFEPASPVATSARASAAALFLTVVIVVGFGGAFVAGGAMVLLGSDGPAPQQLVPGASPVETRAVAVEPTPTPMPEPTLEPISTPEPTQVAKPSIGEQEKADDSDRRERETPEPKKRETPEPKEREREDDEDD